MQYPSSSYDVIKKMTLVMAVALVCFGALAQNERDLSQAFPAYKVEGQQFVPIDITQMELRYVVDVEERKVTGQAKVVFQIEQGGYPLFDLKPQARNVQVNGVSSWVGQITPPQGDTTHNNWTSGLNPELTRPNSSGI